MAIKARKGQTAISRPYIEKMEKIRPLSLYNRGYILYKKWPYFFPFSQCKVFKFQFGLFWPLWPLQGLEQRKWIK